MAERYLGRLEPGMDVCDLGGEKIGTIVLVHRHALAPVGAEGGGAAVQGAERPLRDDVMEVKTGLFGLGHRLYVPVSAIQDALHDCVFLSEAKSAFERLGWYDRPAHLDELQ